MTDKYEDYSDRQKKALIEIDQEERLKDIEKDRDERNNKLQKNKFVREIMGDLGNKIKDSDHKIKIIKKSFLTRLKEGITRIFDQF